MSLKYTATLKCPVPDPEKRPQQCLTNWHGQAQTWAVWALTSAPKGSVVEIYENVPTLVATVAQEASA